MQALVNETYSATFDFTVDGEYVSFDVGASSYTVYDNAGNPIVGHTGVTVLTAEGQNQITLELPADIHTVADGKNFEKRTIVIRTKHADKSYTLKQSYYVTSYLNFSVTEEDVITLIGVREGEILKPSVDLVTAYFKILDVVGSTAMVTALSAGDIRQIKINSAICAQAAIDLTRTIELKALKKLGGDALAYTRFDGIDFNQIRQNLIGLLQEATLDAQGIDPTPTTAFSVSAPTDPITGA